MDGVFGFQLHMLMRDESPASPVTSLARKKCPGMFLVLHRTLVEWKGSKSRISATYQNVMPLNVTASKAVAMIGEQQAAGVEARSAKILRRMSGGINVLHLKKSLWWGLGFLHVLCWFYARNLRFCLLQVACTRVPFFANRGPVNSLV